MFPDTTPPEFPNNTVSTEVSAPPAEDITLFETLVDRLELRELLDLPMIALSNGQTRRARIIKAILRKPELLLLDEPLSTRCKFSIFLVLIGVLAGLDAQNRAKVLQILNSLHNARSPRVIIGLRTQDPVPEWITHVALVGNGRVLTGRKEETLAVAAVHTQEYADPPPLSTTVKTGSLLVDMKNVNVRYGPRAVCSV